MANATHQKKQQHGNQSQPKPAEANGKPKEDKPTGEIKRVRSPKIFAGECPHNPEHSQTKVYRTTGRKRYCKCNDCGATWVQVGEFADDLREYALTMAKSLEESDRVEAPDGGNVIVMDDRTAVDIAKELRRLATT